MKSVLISLLFFSIAISCTEPHEDYVFDPSRYGDDILGVWHLENVSGGLQGLNLDYSRGNVIWTFKQDGKLVVENNIMTTGPEDIHAGLESGVYDFSVSSDSNNNSILNINGQVHGGLEIKDGKLYLGEWVAVDGFMRTMER